jgi:hypothetical protein
MTATNEQIIAEANRRAAADQARHRTAAHYIIEVTREGWTPPPPVDPDVLAFEKWDTTHEYGVTHTIKGAFIAGLELAREQEQERAKVLVEPAEAIVNLARIDLEAVRRPGEGLAGCRLKAVRRLSDGLNAYKAGRAAR